VRRGSIEIAYRIVTESAEPAVRETVYARVADIHTRTSDEFADSFLKLPGRTYT
jgi:hypothetical protein